MEAIAKLIGCPTSPRKMRLVVDLVRGKNVNDAFNILKFAQRHAARDVEKLLLSAVANWGQKNTGGNPEDSNLFVKQIFVDQGRTIKRFQNAPFGRAYRIRKRSNHVTLIIDSREMANNQ